VSARDNTPPDKALRQRLLTVYGRKPVLESLRNPDLHCHTLHLADSNRETAHATFSSHQADAASDSSAFESTYIQRRYEEERFNHVSQALARIEERTYGLD